MKKETESVIKSAVDLGENIAGHAISGYHKIEDGVVGSYKKIENTVVGGYKKIEDAFVDKLLTREGESVEDAKARIKAEQQAREEAANAEAEKRAAEQKSRLNHTNGKQGRT